MIIANTPPLAVVGVLVNRDRSAIAQGAHYIKFRTGAAANFRCFAVDIAGSLGIGGGKGDQRLLAGEGGLRGLGCGNFRFRLGGKLVGNQHTDLLLQKFGGNHLSLWNPADKSGVCGGAVPSFSEELILPGEEPAKIRLCGLGHRFGGRHPHGNHPFDSLQLLVGVIQIQLELLDLQILSLQLQLGQGGIKAQEHIALFHLLVLFHQDLRYGLGVGEVHRLYLVRGHRAITLLGIAPILGHTHIVEFIHLHRLDVVLPQIPPAKKATGTHRRHNRQGDDDLLKLFHWSAPLLSSAARRPECDRFYPRMRQWRARG